ncbi:MAG: ABC-F family ATP-binding cassette domain-containing protein, partial [Sinobacteraceae bacterium]|nr:ABC-F family ATP-binding cassette domain-containing protein [Nevskiaceae bacterium]
MSFVTLSDAHLAYSDRPLLDGAQMSVAHGERLGLIGRNGTGKSTLLRVIAGLVQLDDGELQRRDGLRIAMVEQDPQLPEAATLRESLLARAAVSAEFTAAYADERERWMIEARLAEFLQRFELEASHSPATCSGGERKRATLALAFTLQPELLLLDEPTNHLDIEGIERLEELLPRIPASIVITHDREFLDH